LFHAAGFRVAIKLIPENLSIAHNIITLFDLSTSDPAHFSANITSIMADGKPVLFNAANSVGPKGQNIERIWRPAKDFSTVSRTVGFEWRKTANTARNYIDGLRVGTVRRKDSKQPGYQPSRLSIEIWTDDTKLPVFDPVKDSKDYLHKVSVDYIAYYTHSPV
jgi:hypothetical protein